MSPIIYGGFYRRKNWGRNVDDLGGVTEKKFVDHLQISLGTDPIPWFSTRESHDSRQSTPEEFCVDSTPRVTQVNKKEGFQVRNRPENPLFLTQRTHSQRM